MKKFVIAGVIALIAVALIGTAVLAQEGKVPFKIIWSRETESQQGPDEVYELSDYGLVCVVDNGQLWCGCPCPTCQNGVQTVVSTGNPGSSQTPPPPVITTVPPPATTQPPPPTKEPKQGCNQGGGNGPENGCDPGNSNNNQDSNDEPGHRGGGNK